MTEPGPIPVSRAFSRVLRNQLGGGPGLRLLIGEALAVNPDRSYTDVRIGGVDYTIPKLRVAAYDIPLGAAVYILADADYNIMIAIGYSA